MQPKCEEIIYKPCIYTCHLSLSYTTHLIHVYKNLGLNVCAYQCTSAFTSLYQKCFPSKWFFSGPLRWKLLDARSRLCGGCVRYCQWNCSRNCIVTPAVWWARILSLVLMQPVNCGHEVRHYYRILGRTGYFTSQVSGPWGSSEYRLLLHNTALPEGSHVDESLWLACRENGLSPWLAISYWPCLYSIPEAVLLALYWPFAIQLGSYIIRLSSLWTTEEGLWKKPLVMWWQDENQGVLVTVPWLAFHHARM
jgi:hypothetical protein